MRDEEHGIHPVTALVQDSYRDEPLESIYKDKASAHTAGRAEWEKLARRERRSAALELFVDKNEMSIAHRSYEIAKGGDAQLETSLGWFAMKARVTEKKCEFSLFCAWCWPVGHLEEGPLNCVGLESMWQLDSSEVDILAAGDLIPEMRNVDRMSPISSDQDCADTWLKQRARDVFRSDDYSGRPRVDKCGGAAGHNAFRARIVFFQTK